MSEKLRYFLRQGENRVGRGDAETEQNIVIGGLGILKEHCTVTSDQVHLSMTISNPNNVEESGTILEEPAVNDVVFVRPVGAAKVYINSTLVSEGQSVELHHNDRLILGNSNVFRVSVHHYICEVDRNKHKQMMWYCIQVVIPSARPPDLSEDEIAKESQFDWQLAIKELHNSQLKANQELEAIAEREKQEMDARVKLMEEKYGDLDLNYGARATPNNCDYTLQDARRKEAS